MSSSASSASSSSPVAPAGGWVSAGRLSQLRQGEGRRVQLPGGGRKDAVALFRHGAELFALEDRCCHADKSIHGGDIEDLGQCVVNKDGDMGQGGLCVQCPRHQRKFAGGLYFNLRTGEARTPEYTRKFRKMDTHHVRVHDTRVENGEVFVSVRPRSRRSTQVISDDSEDDRRRPKGFLNQLCSKIPLRTRGSAGPSSPSSAPNEKRLREGDDENDEGEKFLSAPLLEVEEVNHNCFIFHFGQPSGVPLPLPPASPVWHVTLRARIDGRLIDRDYTPVSSWDEWRDTSRVRLLIKIYPDGLMTQYLSKLRKGVSVIDMSGPVTTLQLPSFDSPGKAVPSPNTPSHLILFAAGTGVVPMVQILESLQELSGWSSATLLCSYRQPADLLCAQALLEQAAATRNGKIYLRFTFTTPGSLQQDGAMLPPPLQGFSSEGRADRNLCERLLSHVPNDAALKVIVSGPDGFFEAMKECLPPRLRSLASCVNLDEE
eukprot:CAMPEP_0206449838 /NCGR_PEP_ID=MMETSP0324_2-20121206/18348_1 /ASSEMBLY_ACC=CAM_ASM_000836 /TAXON_ID=2866 /ORGANISM="Crypthecodinium cohnii, Strain Seligo" /LENGTH=487 /DNA_ID=CAMNT_0053919333 /DNA_START=49 /DNA_END=1512 /DNA_ORIENTATION=+